MNEDERQSAIAEARKLYEEKKYDEAIELYEAVRKDIDVGFNSDEIRRVYGEGAFCLFRRGNPKQAMDLWIRAFCPSKTFDFANVIALSGFALFKASEGDSIAENYATTAMSVLVGFPDNPEKEWVVEFVMSCMNEIGMALICSGNNAGAIRTLEEAIKVSGWLEEYTKDPEIARSAMCYRAEIGECYALALIAQERYSVARYELIEEVLFRYREMKAISKTVSVLSKIGLTYEKEGEHSNALAELALGCYKECLKACEEVGDEVRMLRVRKDIKRIEEKLVEQAKNPVNYRRETGF